MQSTHPFTELYCLFVRFFCYKASVHLPRIGHSTKGFNWYGTERLIRKHLASRGIPTFMYLSVCPAHQMLRKKFIHTTCLPERSESLSLNLTDRYYHSRTAKKTAPPQTSTSPTSSPQLQLHNSNRLSDVTEAETPGPSAATPNPGPRGLPSFMSGVRVFFYNLPASERKRLARYLITYPFTPGPIVLVWHLVADASLSTVHVKACVLSFPIILPG